MKLKEMTFVRYHSRFYPRKHATKPDQLLESQDVVHYAVPGGNVVTRPQCELWGMHNNIRVVFNEGTAY